MPIDSTTGGLRLPPWLTNASATEVVKGNTVDDPTTYTAPWTGEYSFYPITGRTYASSCHEGNYSLPNIISYDFVNEEVNRIIIELNDRRLQAVPVD